MKTVVFVDDEKFIHGLFKIGFKKLIREKKIKIHSYLDGNECLDALDKGELKFDDNTYLFTDVTMPHMDGITLSNEIYNRYPSAKIYMLSAIGDDEYQGRTSDIHRFPFFEKPVNINDIKNIILGDETN